MKFEKGVVVRSQIFGSSWYVVVGFNSEATVGHADNVAEYELQKFSRGGPTSRIRRDDETAVDAGELEDWAERENRTVIHESEHLPGKIASFVDNLD